MCKILLGFLLVCRVQSRNVDIQSNWSLAIISMTKSSINFVPYFRYLSEKGKDRKYMNVELHLSLPNISSVSSAGLQGTYRAL